MAPHIRLIRKGGTSLGLPVQQVDGLALFVWQRRSAHALLMRVRETPHSMHNRPRVHTLVSLTYPLPIEEAVLELDEVPNRTFHWG